jgi:hypothetical protein
VRLLLRLLAPHPLACVELLLGDEALLEEEIVQLSKCRDR